MFPTLPSPGFALDGIAQHHPFLNGGRQCEVAEPDEDHFAFKFKQKQMHLLIQSIL
jgi:hypothetical protein